MAQSKRKGTGSTAAVDALLASAQSRYELVVAWDPGQTQPVRFALVMVGGRILITDRMQVDSPVVFHRLPDPSASGKFDVVWTLTPEVPLRTIAMAIVDRQSNAQFKVDSAKDLERGQVWGGSKSVAVS